MFIYLFIGCCSFDLLFDVAGGGAVTLTLFEIDDDTMLTVAGVGIAEINVVATLSSPFGFCCCWLIEYGGYKDVVRDGS